MLHIALVLGALLLRAPAAQALMANMTSEVVCGYLGGGPNRLMACGVAGGRMVDCHNSAQILGDGGRLNIQCRGTYLASGGPQDPYLWTIDGTFNQCACDAWVCTGTTQAMVKDDSALFTWHGPTKGFCCRCRPG